MSDLAYSKLSLRDFEKILDDVGRDRPVAAIELVERIQESCKMLAQSPTMGTTRSDLAPDIRAFTAKPYVIYFRPSVRGIVVVRILHGARDPSRVIRTRR
jgi:toxin ParE1/3/4